MAPDATAAIPPRPYPSAASRIRRADSRARYRPGSGASGGAGMLVSDSKKLLFIHIQKTGGTSLRACLKGVIPDLEEGRGVKYHARLSDALRSGSRFQRGAYYTAAFVRNPWDRLVSWYVYIAGGTAFVPEGHSLFHRQNLLRQGVLRKARTFDEFILHCPNPSLPPCHTISRYIR